MARSFLSSFARHSVDKIIAELVIVDMPENSPIFCCGTQAVFHSHCIEEECTITKIFEVTDRKGVCSKSATFAKVGQKGVFMVEIARSIPCDTFDIAPFLGRFTLRTEGKTICIGKIKKLPPKK